MDASLPRAVEAGPNDESGRGLLLVNALADDWGTRQEPPGKTTWFEVMPKPSTDGLGNNSVDAPPSPRADEASLRRTQYPARMAPPADSRSPFVSATTGKRSRAA
jgi:hypothetical protein